MWPGSIGIFKKEFGQKAEVWDREKVVIIPDHYIFTSDECANRNVDILRDFCQEQNIKYFYDIKDLSNFKVPPTLRFVLDGEMPHYLLAKDLILQFCSHFLNIHNECGYYVILYMFNIIQSGQTTDFEKFLVLRQRTRRKTLIWVETLWLAIFFHT
ncbi:hypothetical protein K1719_002586 [Acacia pycnantha]|nr:hypothetical protein K1719_002586 [Acacia pycnantha]